MHGRNRGEACKEMQRWPVTVVTVLAKLSLNEIVTDKSKRSPITEF